jgi:hypothetical protein
MLLSVDNNMPKGGELEMWRSKKFIAIVLAAVLLVGGTVGVVLAADNGDEDGSLPEARPEALLDRVCAIYQENTGNDIDPEALKDAFAQASSEMRNEALQSRLQNLVDQDKITQEQAKQYLEWWESKPDFPFNFGFRGRGGLRGCGRLVAPQNN